MLEILIFSLILIGVVVWLRKRPRKQRPAPNDKAAVVCPRCGEKDCHCERRS